MRQTLVTVLLMLWLVGLVSNYTLGGLIHVLLVVGLALMFSDLRGPRRQH